VQTIVLAFAASTHLVLGLAVPFHIAAGDFEPFEAVDLITKILPAENLGAAGLACLKRLALARLAVVPLPHRVRQCASDAAPFDDVRNHSALTFSSAAMMCCDMPCKTASSSGGNALRSFARFAI
jgi:hypothetical protein